MLTNQIPFERLFHNDKMWYKFEGYTKTNKPIVKECPSGCASHVGDGNHFYFSDNYDELYNHWVDNLNSKDGYEKLTDEHLKLLNKIKDERIKKEYDFRHAPFFRYYIAFYDAKQTTLDELSKKITQHIDEVIAHLRVGMVMSEWSPDAHWNYIVTNFKYNRKTKVLVINTLDFFVQNGNVSGEKERIFDIKTENGIKKLAAFMGYDRGYWQDFNELIKAYQEKVDKQVKFIKSIKRLL